ncbi:MAG: MiaB/RimO family radical SAM methylthiotransferase, partial [Gammaproteobacteria bacterium]
ASLEPQAQAALPGVDQLVPNADTDRHVELVTERLALPALPIAAPDIGAATALGRNRVRAFVKVQDGCRHRCTFCIVTVARGAERSRPIPDIVAEIRALHAAGANEAVLTGVHVGGFGRDLGTDLAALLRAILDDTDLPRLRLASVEPWDLPQGFGRVFANRRLQPHLHLPLQSGCDRTLRRMARRCRSDDFRALVESLRAQVADFNVTTDVIAGFPGETAADWAESLNFIDALGFGGLHVFAFSARPGTAAARLQDRVPAQEIRLRCAQLQDLHARLRRDYLTRFIGRKMEVLWEFAAPGQSPAGYTSNYLRCTSGTAAGGPPPNTFSQVRMARLGADGATLVGTP